MDLKEWTIEYVKHRDLHKKELEGIDNQGDHLHFHFENEEQVYLLKKSLDKEVLDLKPDTDVKVVCSNQESNLQFLVNNWDTLKEKKGLTLIFVNVAANEKWILRPDIHDRIADPESLEEGLKTMYEQVAPE